MPAADSPASFLPPNFANPPDSPINAILKDIPLPRLVSMETAFDRPVLADVAQAFLAKLQASHVLDRIRPGMRLAIGLAGDIVAALAAQGVGDPDELVARLPGAAVGQPAPVEILRGGQPRTVTVTIGERK